MSHDVLLLQIQQQQQMLLLLICRSLDHMAQRTQGLTQQQEMTRLRAQMAARNNQPILLVSDPPGKLHSCQLEGGSWKIPAQQHCLLGLFSITRHSVHY